MNFLSLRIVGSIFNLEQLVSVESLVGQQPADFGLVSEGNVKDEVAKLWSEANRTWERFQGRLSKSTGRSGIAETRNDFVVPFLTSLGFQLKRLDSPLAAGAKEYEVSHHDTSHADLKIHIVGALEHSGLDKVKPGTKYRISPSAMLQDYLNLTEDLYAIITNGFVLRILRDNSRLAQQSYFEVDFRVMFSERLYSEFAVMYRFLHSSRFSTDGTGQSSCLLEQYHQSSIEAGQRLREDLSFAVKRFIVQVGSGFLRSRSNVDLINSLSNGGLTLSEYYCWLLRLVYRVLFLLVTEERSLLFPDNNSFHAAVYREFYSVGRVRELSRHKTVYNRRATDLWESLKSTFELFTENGRGAKIGITPLVSELFTNGSIGVLSTSLLDNESLLTALNLLCFAQSGETGSTYRVNYGALNVEELGSVYEGLLDLRLVVIPIGTQLSVEFADSEDRGNTGSYYTPDSLIQTILAETLAKKISEVVTAYKTDLQSRERHLLELKVVDPAMGSGHFLVASARMLGRAIALCRSEDNPPSDDQIREATRDAIRSCVYGIDINPMAVELCKLALWIESMQPGMPLTILDNRLVCGNTTISTTFEQVENGIPDAAYTVVDKNDSASVARAWLRRNLSEKNGQTALDWSDSRTVDVPKLSGQTTVEGVVRDYETYANYLSSISTVTDRFDLWCFAYLVEKSAEEPPITSSSHLEMSNPLAHSIAYLRERFRPIHWQLVFPEVYSRGGFDVVVGNPPWISYAGRATKPIDAREKHFLRSEYKAFSGYPSLHGVFCEVGTRLLNSTGRLGFVLPKSVSELSGYGACREVVTSTCIVHEPLPDFGDFAFIGVNLPSFSLIASKKPQTTGGSTLPWKLDRLDFSTAELELLHRVLADSQEVPDIAFAERGFQSTPKDLQAFVDLPTILDGFIPIREGRDIQPFHLLEPRRGLYAEKLLSKYRPICEYEEVDLLVRQTARYPMVAISDGGMFRNSLIAGYSFGEWSPAALCSYYNSNLIRWMHYNRYMDARQAVMPQVKISHLRSIRFPQDFGNDFIDKLDKLYHRRHSGESAVDSIIDELVYAAFKLSIEDINLLSSWKVRFNNN